MIPDRAAASDPFVAAAIRKASAVFIAGGDQANYINFWMGTPVQQALNDAIARNIPMGERARVWRCRANLCIRRRAIFRMAPT